MKFTLVVAAAALFCHAAVANADDKIKLKVASFLPASHFQVEHGSKPWMKEVTRLTGGKVEFEYYPAEQMGKASQLLDLMNAGVIDVAEVPPAYVTDKLPLVGVLEMPGLVPNSCRGASALRALSEPGGTIYESDFVSSGVRPLTFFIYPPYSIIARRPVQAIGDFKGMKLRTSGGAMELVANELGAAPVRMPAPEVFQSLQRGTLDAVMYSFLSARDADLGAVATHAGYGYGLGAPSVLISISQKRFAQLPADVQDALVKAGPVADQSYCHYVDENEVRSRDEMEKAGMKIHTFSDGEKAELDKLLSTIAVNWAKGLDGRGKPASRALEEFSARIKASE